MFPPWRTVICIVITFMKMVQIYISFHSCTKPMKIFIFSDNVDDMNMTKCEPNDKCSVRDTEKA